MDHAPTVAAHEQEVRQLYGEESSERDYGTDTDKQAGDGHENPRRERNLSEQAAYNIVKTIFISAPISSQCTRKPRFKPRTKEAASLMPGTRARSSITRARVNMRTGNRASKTRMLPAGFLFGLLVCTIDVGGRRMAAGGRYQSSPETSAR